MVSVRRRKMNRSGVKKNTRKNNNQDHYNPRSNPIIAKHWDNSLTAKQNYKKLGLTFRIGAATGGEEKKLVIAPIERGNMEESLFDEDNEEQLEESNEDELDPYDPANILEGTAKIMKDENGKVIKIVYGTKKLKSVKVLETDAQSELNDVDAAESDNEEAKQVIAELEELANLPKKKEIHQMNEVEILRYRKLIEKYGEDYEKMKWDKKLNPFQLSPGQLRKELNRYKSLYE